MEGKLDWTERAALALISLFLVVVCFIFSFGPIPWLTSEACLKYGSF